MSSIFPPSNIDVVSHIIPDLFLFPLMFCFTRVSIVAFLPCNSAFPARRAIVFASDTLPTLAPHHRIFAAVTRRIFEQVWRHKTFDDDEDSDSDCELGAVEEIVSSSKKKPENVSAKKRAMRKLRTLVTDDWDSSSDEDNWSDEEGADADDKEREKDSPPPPKDEPPPPPLTEEERRAKKLEELKTTLPGLTTLLDMGFDPVLAVAAAERHGITFAPLNHFINLIHFAPHSHFSRKWSLCLIDFAPKVRICKRPLTTC